MLHQGWEAVGTWGSHPTALNLRVRVPLAGGHLPPGPRHSWEPSPALGPESLEPEGPPGPDLAGNPPASQVEEVPQAVRGRGAFQSK